MGVYSSFIFCYFILDSMHWLISVMVEDLALQNVLLFSFLFLLIITKLFRKILFESKFAVMMKIKITDEQFSNSLKLVFFIFLDISNRLFFF